MDSQPNWTPQVSRYEDMGSDALGNGEHTSSVPVLSNIDYPPPLPTEHFPFSQESLPPDAGGM